MGTILGRFLLVMLAALISSDPAITVASNFQPISDSHRFATLEIFVPQDGSFGSLEETYQALRTFEVLGVDRKPEISNAACRSVVAALGSSFSPSKELFYALKVNGIVSCEISGKVFEDIISSLQAAAGNASSLFDFYYSIGSLVLIKDQTSKDDLQLGDAERIFRSFKALSQSDGKWRYSANNPDSSASAAGLALEALAGVISLSSSEIDQSLVDTSKNDILKLFDIIEKYDDGAVYFDDKLVSAHELQGPLSTTSSVVRGITAFAAVTSGSLHIPGDKILGLAKFFLGIGIPGDAKDLFNQVDSLAVLENNRISIPLILSLPATVLSLTKNDVLKVKVNTVLGSNAPPLAVKLVQVLGSNSKDALVVDSKELNFDPSSSAFILDTLPRSIDVGKYIFVFETVLRDSEHKKAYVTESKTNVPIYVTGVIKVDNAEILVLDSHLGSIETQKNALDLCRLDLGGENLASLSASHLQKLRLSFQLTSPLGQTFNPHQAVLKLTHETKVEHAYVVGNSGKQFEIVLDFLGLVEKLYYLSGRYDIQLTVGDTFMENSFLKEIGHIDLDLPDPPEKAPRPPALPVDTYTQYGPKAEISHIFKEPEKRPPQKLSHTFLGLTLLPFIGFLVGLLRLGVNLKIFPSSTAPATFAVLFHLGIAAVLVLYILFWLKLDLFSTLKALAFLGPFLMFVGHRILSHLASTSTKLKSA